MSVFWLDLRYSFQSLRRSAGFSALVIGTLALAIGGCSAIFSFVNGVLLRPLPYPESDRLVVVCETNEEVLSGYCAASPGNLRLWQAHATSFESLGLGRRWSFKLRGGDRPLPVVGGIAGGELFRVFRAQAGLGRLLGPDDSTPGHEHVVVLAHSLWQGHFGGDPEILGKTVRLAYDSYEVVGVLPADFEVPELADVDLWIPLWPERVEWREWRGLKPFGRLADGVSPAMARAEMATLAKRFAAEFPDSNEGWGIEVEPLRDRIVGPVRRALWLLAGAVGLVFLIACANVANLFLARAASRETLLAVRHALGASRGRLVRLVLTEAILLAMASGAAGLLLAVWLTDLFLRLAPSSFPRTEQVTLDGPAVVFTLIVTAVTALLFGLAPALQAGRMNLQAVLKSGTREGSDGRGRRGRALLVVAETALALVLLNGAGLLGRDFVGLLDWRPGFPVERLALVPVFISPGDYPEGRQVADLYGRLLEELRALPGVEAATAASAGPLFGGDGGQEIVREGEPLPPPGRRPTALWFDVGPRYFETLGIALKAGRFLSERDGPEAPRVAVVNETLARRLFGDASPLGKRVRMLLHDASFEIVGVVADVRPFLPGEETPPEIYWPYRQLPRWAIHLVLRSRRDPVALLPSVRQRLAEVEPNLDIGRVSTLEQRMAAQRIHPRFYLLLMASFAFLATTIAVVGVYGVLSYWVTQRTHELGVRMALGARPGEILGMVLRRGMALCLLGIAVGMAGSVGLARLIRGLLVAVSPTDPMTFGGAAALLAVAALLACGIPARRALRLDPLRAIRWS